MELTKEQRHTIIACFLGWTLDAFDFFIMIFLLKDIAHTFNTDITIVTIAIMLTLAMRPIGALIFGRLADKYGRRPILMLNILMFSVFEFFTAFSPNLTIFFILRTLFGIAMGGEWGIGSALMMESIPTKSRGLASGILQTGYPMGYLLASIVYALIYNYIGWRGMFIIGVIPAFLVMYIRSSVPESEFWKKQGIKPKPSFLSVIRYNWKISVFAIVLMTAFNFFSHGSQDLYPTFLQVQHGFDTHVVGTIAIIYNIGAIIGGLFFGYISEYIGRRKAIIIGALLALPMIPLWAFSTTPILLGLGAFLIQIAIQGAWGVIPAYLNELSPSEIRATFPGTVYQLGNFLASANATLQAFMASHLAGQYSIAMSIVVGTVAVVITVLMIFGPERHGVNLAE
jgi:SHS family lactate transporter-like MFS transporter